jgi:hypothetical protein
MMMNKDLSVNAGAVISGTSQTQYAGFGTAVRSSTDSANSVSKNAVPDHEAVKVSLSKSAEVFSAEAEKKDEVTVAAIQGRSAKEGLEKASAVLDEMGTQLALVKNFPPFPAGNEERAQYLNSLEGLRKELQSLAIPPVSAEYEPVFYPREDVFPPLDVKVPSDAAVLAFGDAVLAVKDNLSTARAALETQLAKVAENAGYVRAAGETGAREISKAIASQIQGRAQPLSSGSDVYAQI